VKKLLYVALVPILFTACKDPEMDALMGEYCGCLHSNKGDIEGRLECIELMDSIQKKYKNQPRKLQQVLEKTNECF
jgi:hypothetical protein